MSTTSHRSITSAQLEVAALTFDLLSVPGRLHLVWLLASQELDVTTLAEATGATIAATSQQLAKLRAAGVASARRDGRRQLYRADDPHVVAVIEQIFAHIDPDGTLAADPQRPRPPRGPASPPPDPREVKTNVKSHHRYPRRQQVQKPPQDPLDDLRAQLPEPFRDAPTAQIAQLWVAWDAAQQGHRAGYLIDTLAIPTEIAQRLVSLAQHERSRRGEPHPPRSPQ